MSSRCAWEYSKAWAVGLIAAGAAITMILLAALGIAWVVHDPAATRPPSSKPPCLSGHDWEHNGHLTFICDHYGLMPSPSP